MGENQPFHRYLVIRFEVHIHDDLHILHECDVQQLMCICDTLEDAHTFMEEYTMDMGWDFPEPKTWPTTYVQAGLRGRIVKFGRKDTPLDGRTAYERVCLYEVPLRKPRMDDSGGQAAIMERMKVGAIVGRGNAKVALLAALLIAGAILDPKLFRKK